MDNFKLGGKKGKKSNIVTETDLISAQEKERAEAIKGAQSSNKTSIPFDFFGVSARFYVDGKSRTLIGSAASVA